MTTRSAQPDRRPVDIDLLADYLGDALDPADAAIVAGLITTDADWRAAFQSLSAATSDVSAALTAYATPVTMPGDVAARIDAALAETAQADEADAATDAAIPDRPLGPDRPAGRPGGATARGPARSGTPGRPPNRRRRRLLTGSAVALLVIAGIALVGMLMVHSIPPSAVKSSAGGAPDSATLSPVAGLTPTASGTDYTAATLGAPIAPTTAAGPVVPRPTATHRGIAPQATGESGGGSGYYGGMITVPSGLQRLTNPAALSACLTDVENSNGATASSIDFASYNGAPALIITLPAAHRVVAVGPECGDTGTDTIATAALR